MASLEKLQEQLLDEELLAELELENTTPVIIGGYNARPYSAELNLMEEPRPTEIKGLWRWWARSLVSGALLTKGIDVNIAEANKIIAPILGGLMEGALEPSKLTISTEVLDQEHIDLSMYTNRNRNKDGIEIVRLKLLSQGLRSQREFQERFKAYSRLRLRLKVYKYYANLEKIPQSFYEFSLYSLVLSLMFSGLGAITTRAFGSVKVKITRLGKTLGNIQDLIKLQEILNTLYYRSRISIDEVREKIWEVIRLALNSANKYISSLKRLGSFSRVNGLPSTPSIVVDNANAFRLEVLLCNANTYKLLSVVGSSMLKQQMKSSCFEINPRDPGVNIHTFVLGLPRTSVIPYGRQHKLRTGYIVPKQKFNQRQRRFDANQINAAIQAIDEDKTGRLRRISTIGFTLLRDNPPIILVYGMLAKDIDIIKHEIVHRGVHGRPGPRGHVRRIVDTRLDHVNVVNEFNNLWNCIIELIRRECSRR